MSTTNYFKCADGKIFGFDDVPHRGGRSIEETYSFALAWQRAISPKPLVIFRPVPHAGPWDTCAIVGHRHRSQILRGFGLVTHPVSIDRLRAERDALLERFAEVGRAIPPELVEAA